MKLKDAIDEALKNEKTHEDPFLLHSCVSDLVGNDLEAKDEAERFFRQNADNSITRFILSSRARLQKKAARGAVAPPPHLPPKAFVYYDTCTSLKTGGNLMHMSLSCPALKGKKVWQNPYFFARDMDAYHASVAWDAREKHKPAFCPVCIDFTPTYPDRLRDKLRIFLFSKFGWGLPGKILTP